MSETNAWRYRFFDADGTNPSGWHYKDEKPTHLKVPVFELQELLVNTRADSGEADGAVAYQIRIPTGNWHECTWDEFERVSHNLPNDARRLFTHPRATAVDVRDAERYRWLRRRICFTGNGDGSASMHVINLPDTPYFPEMEIEKAVDQAIDAAIASREGEGK
jgi:hypothetical protein